MAERILTRNFSDACQKHHSDMAYLRGLVQGLQGKSFLDSIPLYSPDRWSLEIDTNCLAFGLDTSHQGRIQPGYLSTGTNKSNNQRPQDIQSYSDSIHNDLLRDGLTYIGDDLKICEAGCAPIAIFYKNTGDGLDYHVYALRRTFNSYSSECDNLVWVSKIGYDVSVCDSRTIFGDAQMKRYEIFGGYYNTPALRR